VFFKVGALCPIYAVTAAFGKMRGAGVTTGKMRGKRASVTVRGLGK